MFYFLTKQTETFECRTINNVNRLEDVRILMTRYLCEDCLSNRVNDFLLEKQIIIKYIYPGNCAHQRTVDLNNTAVHSKLDLSTQW